MTSPMRRGRYQETVAKVDQIESAGADTTHVYGRVMVEGAGETLVHIDFPVTYTGKPFPFPGIPELERTDSPQPSFYPSAQMAIAGWDLTDQGSGEATALYRGVTLAITTNGRTDQRIWVTYAFIGIALTNPITE